MLVLLKWLIFCVRLMKWISNPIWPKKPKPAHPSRAIHLWAEYEY